MSEDLCNLGIADAGALMARREITPLDLVDACLDRIANLDPQINAFITVTGDAARIRARQLGDQLLKGGYHGLLHGIPFGLKDMFNTAGTRTTANSRVLAHHVPARNARVVDKLYDAGAILLGKHAAHEFAHSGPTFDLPWPPARNPWDTDRYTGGSSTGSGASVAAGLGAFALGTDTGGSVRIPAWHCGLTGMKPTFGLISRHGVIPYSPSCDHVGPLTRSVHDTAIVLQAIAGYDENDPGSRRYTGPDFLKDLNAGMKGMRFGVLRHHWEEDVSADAELVAALDEALLVMRTLGAQVEDVRVRPLHEYYAVRVVISESEMFAWHRPDLIRNASQHGDRFLGRALAGCLFNADDYRAAQGERTRMIMELNKLHDRYDALITIGAGPAPLIESFRIMTGAQKWLSPSMGTVFSVTGAPALALPCGFSRTGLPLGMQIAGRPFEDARVLRIGQAYERATGWTARRAPIIAGGPVAPRHVAQRYETPIVDLDASTHATVEACILRADFTLNDHQYALLCESAPHALDMARRIPRHEA